MERDADPVTSSRGRGLKELTTLATYYDWLSRYEQAVRWLGRTSGQPTLTVHRLLNSTSDDIAPAHVVHERLLRALGSNVPARTIDAGCGTGGTILYLHDRIRGEYDGLTVSVAQARRATEAARARSVEHACRFHVRSFDVSLTDLAPAGVDLIVAIESLAHSASPGKTIANLAKSLAAGGRLAIVDDMPDERLPNHDPDFQGFRDGWRCPAIARSSELIAACSAAGLSIEHDEDLTPLVALRPEHQLERLVRVNRLVNVALGWTPLGIVLDSLWGGLLLERLYRRGLMQYRLIVARREPDPRKGPR